ncbi:MAG: hypothetical protein BWY11_00770 [Firmicutes bacterium ADurb.Bin182]|nr:MAG: hypothetical protein BWY11_00770 [Firmicutes bacterium ADurb.Bin182]
MYMTVTEASEKWGVSLRQVQRLVIENRISGVQKFGRAWMLPADAEKPADFRKKKQLTKINKKDELAFVIAATTIPMPRENPDEILKKVKAERLRLIYEAELSYLRGDFARAMDCYHETAHDNAARLRACPLAIATAISIGDYREYTEIETFLKQTDQTGTESNIKAFAQLSLATAAVSMIAPNMAPDWLRTGDLSALPLQAKPNALYLRAKYLHCIGQCDSMLAVAQTALTLSSANSCVTVTDIYLRVTCAVACYALGQADEAKRWLLETMRIALPHGFITPFAEIVTALGGLVEQCLKQEFPDSYNTVIDQWKRTWKNWIAFHNRFTNDNITLVLSLREYHLALAVSRRVPYAKIAEQNNISVGRLKNIMREVYDKLFITGRDELSKFVF